MTAEEIEKLTDNSKIKEKALYKQLRLRMNIGIAITLVLFGLLTLSNFIYVPILFLMAIASIAVISVCFTLAVVVKIEKEQYYRHTLLKNQK